MRRLVHATLLALSLAALPVAAATASGPSVAWVPAAADADIDKAFARARSEGKPLLLYWGAAWCPPCNQLKATLFNRQDFIERSRAVVPVAIDGDLPGAQKLGGRFKVRGYPTLILMAADGREITRLPGEVDAPQVMAVLQLALSGGRPAKAVLADALAGKPLTAAEWRMLAFYAWDVDEDQLAARGDRAGVLTQLAAACPAAQAETSNRLLLRALADSDEGQGMRPDAATRRRVLALLADPAATRKQMDLVVNGAAEIAKALAPDPGADRKAVVGALDAALQRLQADASLSRADRSGAVQARVDLARLPYGKEERHPKLAPALLAQVREQAARDDREITDAYERQAVITADAHLLAQSGLWSESDKLLEANLSRSHSPYYLMSQLGGNARKQGRNADALRWFERAWDKSEGPATRLQWGASYVSALVELSPKDDARIERAAAKMFDEAARDPAAFHERSARSLQRVGSKLAAWGGGPGHEESLRRLQSQLAGVCVKLPTADPQRATCDGVAKSIAPASA